MILLTFSDLGKILVLPAFGELPQWAVVGENTSSLIQSLLLFLSA